MKKWLVLGALLAGCGGAAKTEEYPYVRVQCFPPGGQPMSGIITKQELTRFTFHDIPCVFELLRDVPPAPMAQEPEPTAAPSPTAAVRK